LGFYDVIALTSHINERRESPRENKEKYLIKKVKVRSYHDKVLILFLVDLAIHGLTP